MPSGQQSARMTHYLWSYVQALKDNSWDELSQAQRRIVDEQLRDFKNGGVALEVRRKVIISKTN